jgi:Predicted membrane protein
MWTLGTPPLELVIRAALIYLVFFGALRLFGKREIGQFTLFDLALVLLAANALQPAITGPDQSITGGLIVILTIFSLNRGIAALRVRSALIRRLLEFGPTVVGRDGAWLLPQLVRQGLDLVDVEAALREHGLDAVEQMKLATLEADGSISIVATETAETAEATRRRRRFRRPI